MTNQDKIADYLRRYVTVSDEEALFFSEHFEESKLRKKQLTIQPGFIAKKRFYVIDGAMRSFIITPSGQDVTLALAIADWWITDYNSYIYQQPATLFVQALTNTTVLQLGYEAEQRLKEANPKYETFFRIIAERGLAAQQRRIFTNLTQSAEERYDSFVEKYPGFLPVVPQYILASFLGMSTEFLSKIRNNKVKRKS